MLKVENWETYQSYKDRRPPWIRFHRSMLDNYEYQQMSADARALLPMLWLLACEDEDPKSGLIRSDLKKISFRLRIELDVLVSAVKELQDADFIESYESVSGSLRSRNETVTPETETETETETENPLSGKPDSATEILVREETGNNPKELSKQVLDYLNAKRASNYKNTEANAKLIRARLKEGHTVDELIAVIDAKNEEWSGSRKMAKYIRPATLFNAEKFNQYVGELKSTDKESDMSWLDDAEVASTKDNVIEGVFTHG